MKIAVRVVAILQGSLYEISRDAFVVSHSVKIVVRVVTIRHGSSFEISLGAFVVSNPFKIAVRVIAIRQSCLFEISLGDYSVAHSFLGVGQFIHNVSDGVYPLVNFKILSTLASYRIVKLLLQHFFVSYEEGFALGH